MNKQQHEASKLLSQWSDKSLGDFWTLSRHFSSNENDFIEVVERSSYLFRRRRYKALGDLDRTFFSEWRRKFPIYRREKEELLLFVLLFQLDWSIQKVSELTRMHEGRIRFLVTQALMTQYEEEEGVLPHAAPGKSCSRFDLYLLDALLEISWSGGLSGYGIAEFKRHASSCSRCGSIWEFSKGLKMRLAQASAAESVPDESREILWDKKLQSRRIRKRLGAPLYSLKLRLALQLSLLFIILGAMASVPFIGDLKYQFWTFSPGEFFNLDGIAKEPIEKPQSALAQLGEDAGDVWSQVEDYLAQATPPVWATPLMLDNKQSIQPPVLMSAGNGEPREPSKQELIVFKNYGLLAQAKQPTTGDTTKGDPQKKSPEATAPSQATISSASAAVAASRSQKKASDWSPQNFYRWGAYVEDPNSAAEKILAILYRYEAKQTGEFELGANYRKGRYFHFMVNAADYPKLISEIQALDLSGFTNVKAKSSRSTEASKRRIVFLVRGRGR